MSLLLNIYTATETASVALMNGEEQVAIERSTEQRNHAAWLQPAIQKIINDNGYTIEKLSAVAVAEGPGSYTGLRVGMATAKGLCYALKIPLITESTLTVMAFASVKKGHQKNKNANKEQIALFCPMIDARRLEVFSAVYNEQLEIVETATAKILDENSYSNLLQNHKIVFSGSGSGKFEKMINNTHAAFQNVETTAFDLGVLSYRKYLHVAFADLAYTEPAYLREFHLAGQ